MNKLQQLFGAFDALKTPPRLFVLMGNFLSHPFGKGASPTPLPPIQRWPKGMPPADHLPDCPVQTPRTTARWARPSTSWRR